MRLLLRIPWMMLISKFGKRQNLLDESCINLRVLPNDCDINIHMNNARFNNMTVLGRIYHMGKVGIDIEFIKRGWNPIVFSSDTVHLKPIKPFQKFKLRTKILTWDEKYWYYKHLFEIGENLHAVNLTMGVVICRGKVITLDEISDELDMSITPPEIPDTVKQWKLLHEEMKGITIREY